MRRNGFEELVQWKMEEYADSKQMQGLDEAGRRRVAENEAMAAMCEDMLKDETRVRELLQKDPDLFDKIYEFINKALDSFRAIVKNDRGDIEATRLIRDIEATRDMWYGLLEENRGREATADVEQESRKDKKKNTEGRSARLLNRPTSHQIGEGITAPKPLKAAIQTLGIDLNIEQASEEVKRNIGIFAEVYDSIGNGTIPNGVRKPITPGNLEGSLNALGITVRGGNKPSNDARSSYSIDSKHTLRISDHEAHANNFEINEDDEHLSIYLRGSKKEGDFEADDNRNVIEVVFKKNYLERNRDKFQSLIKDIARYYFGGQYTDTAGAYEVHISGSDEFRERASARFDKGKVTVGYKEPTRATLEDVSNRKNRDGSNESGTDKGETGTPNQETKPISEPDTADPGVTAEQLAESVEKAGIETKEETGERKEFGYSDRELREELYDVWGNRQRPSDETYEQAYERNLDEWQQRVGMREYKTLIDDIVKEYGSIEEYAKHLAERDVRENEEVLRKWKPFEERANELVEQGLSEREAAEQAYGETVKNKTEADQTEAEQSETEADQTVDKLPPTVGPGNVPVYDWRQGTGTETPAGGTTSSVCLADFIGSTSTVDCQSSATLNIASKGDNQPRHLRGR